MFAEGSKNKFQHNPDGTTFIFLETKNKYFPGKYTVVIDTEDWDRVKEYSWSIRGNDRCPYVSALIPHPDGSWHYYTREGKEKRRRRRTTLALHHLIFGKPQKGMVVDHINHNGLDNRKENIRFATHSQYDQNRRSRIGSSSKYKGVYWHKAKGKWISNITIDGCCTHIGYFTCEHQAALAYNKKAKELFGEFANLNVVPEEYIIKYEGKI